jgi:multidrug efflux system membrane fusion protein
VVVTLGSRKNAVVVPTSAIQTSQQGEFVYVVKKDNSVEMRPITPVLATGEETVIEKGLIAGETVVLDGQLRLVPGAKVTTVEKRPDAGTKE